MRLKLFAVLLVLPFVVNHTLAQDQKSTGLLLIESRIAAANSHYKTVLTLIADKKTEAKLAKDKSEVKRIETLDEDRKSTEEEINDLVKSYNSLSRKRRS